MSLVVQNIMNNNKKEGIEIYLKFYNSIKLFFIQHYLANAEMLKGSSMQSCNELEEELEIRLEPSLMSYLLSFGESINIPEFNSSSIFAIIRESCG